MTSNGSLGLGPSYLKIGDRAYVLSGGELPFILRPEDNGNHYVVMGDCYIDGLMQGEAPEAARSGASLEANVKLEGLNQKENMGLKPTWVTIW